GPSLPHYFNADTYAFEKPLKLVQGADSMGYDAPRNRAYIVTGGKEVPMPDSWLEQVNPRTGARINKAHFASANVQGMAVEQAGPHLYINVSDQHYIAVLDKVSLKELARWPVDPALGTNCCFAFDEPGHRLFLATRAPGNLLVLDSRSGAVLARFKAPERVDQIEWDARHRRVYVIGGEGWIQIIEARGKDQFVELPRLDTAPGAKTSVLVPSRNELYVAVSPGDSKAMARILRISTGR
ncbi:MAG TPA: hypothetical protein VFF94_11235, partial [Novosphingobium sp.]|nr:hypothetical protein [Novosphingobium sp.]